MNTNEMNMARLLRQRDAEIETLRELLVRVLIVEGRCPTRLLTEIKAALAGKEPPQP